MSILHLLRGILTAISGLSAKTYSCGGDGSRFGGGVSDSFLKYFAIPTGSSIAMAASSSVGGADDNEETSESEGDMVEVMGDDGEGEEVSFAHASVTSAPILPPKGDYLIHSQRDCFFSMRIFLLRPAIGFYKCHDLQQWEI